MCCPHCASACVQRSRRRGMRDRIAAWLNRWPYRCGSCSLRFWSNQRYPVQPTPSWQAPPPPVVNPIAKIEVRATSQAELDQILLSLNRALQQFQSGPGAAPEKQRQSRTSSRPSALIR